MQKTLFKNLFLLCKHQNVLYRFIWYIASKYLNDIYYRILYNSHRKDLGITLLKSDLKNNELILTVDERLDLLNVFKLILNELKFGPLNSLIKKNTTVKFEVQYKCNKEVFTYNFFL